MGNASGLAGPDSGVWADSAAPVAPPALGRQRGKGGGTLASAGPALPISQESTEVLRTANQTQTRGGLEQLVDCRVPADAVMRDIVVRRVHASRLRIALLVLLAAAWGVLVDFNVIPILAPTGNSTIVQASTAACFAALGVLFGPIPGALGGLVRDGGGHILVLLLHPNLNSVEALARAIPDILEDVMLGLIPGLVGLSTRRLVPLLTATAAAAWISLPFLEVGNVVVVGRPGSIWTVLTTAPGDWNEPVDPGLTVYALLAAGMTAVVLARYASNPRRTRRYGAILMAAGGLMIVLGAHR